MYIKFFKKHNKLDQNSQKIEWGSVNYHVSLSKGGNRGEKIIVNQDKLGPGSSTVLGYFTKIIKKK